MPLAHLIATYGYLAIGVGTFLEGETVLVLGGYAAHDGYLELPWVIGCAFLGTVLGDQMYFYIGRIKGKAAIESRPRWKSRSEKVLSLLEKHQNGVILGFRFLYGLRTITPFLIGASNISPLRFLALNTLGASVWAVSFGTLGYLFGYAMQLMLGNIRKYELLVFILVALAGAVAWLIQLRKH